MIDEADRDGDGEVSDSNLRPSINHVCFWKSEFCISPDVFEEDFWYMLKQTHAHDVL